jgi:hypothetical protein
VEGSDKPKLSLQVIATLLGTHELQDIVVIQLRQFENFLFRQP